MLKLKKFFCLFILIFFSFNINYSYSIYNYNENEQILVKQKIKVLKIGIVKYKNNLLKIKQNYDLLKDSVLNKSIKKLDLIILSLDNIKNTEKNLKNSIEKIKILIKSFNKIKKENSIYLKNILKKVKNPEVLKKIKKEFDLLAINSKKISYLLDNLIYKFGKFIDKIKNKQKKEKLKKSLKNLYIISLKLKNFRSFIYMGNKSPKKTFYLLLKEIKNELLKIKENL